MNTREDLLGDLPATGGRPKFGADKPAPVADVPTCVDCGATELSAVPKKTWDDGKKLRYYPADDEYSCQPCASGTPEPGIPWDDPDANPAQDFRDAVKKFEDEGGFKRDKPRFNVGGVVKPGRTFLVGENGPEKFVTTKASYVDRIQDGVAYLGDEPIGTVLREEVGPDLDHKIELLLHSPSFTEMLDLMERTRRDIVQLCAFPFIPKS